ncbi:MAG: hypothetical protein GY928_04950 [Colwellia sp.]|nr:hypothetical protein [Colwellia sp.]
MAQRVNMSPMGLPIAKKTFLAKTETVGSVVNFMRSMRMGIEYEGILEDVTPNNNTDLSSIGILYVGEGGDVVVDGANGGTNITLVGVPSGTWLNFIRVKRVRSTGTTAGSIVLAR